MSKQPNKLEIEFNLRISNSGGKNPWPWMIMLAFLMTPLFAGVYYLIHSKDQLQHIRPVLWMWRFFVDIVIAHPP